MLFLLMLAGVSAAPAGKDAHGSTLAMDRINQLLQRAPPKRVDGPKCAVPHPDPQSAQVGPCVDQKTLSKILRMAPPTTGVGLRWHPPPPAEMARVGAEWLATG